MIMHAKIFYFKNRNDLHQKIGVLKKHFLKGKGQFIYRDQDNRLLIVTDLDIDGQEAFIINEDRDIIKILEGLDFNTFAVRSRRKNAMQENRRIGELVLRNFKDKKVDLENPDIIIYIDQARDISFFYIKRD